MDTLRGSTSAPSIHLGSTRLGLRIFATLFVLAGLLSGAFRAQEVGAQPAPTADIEIRVHSCPDDFDGTGFFQHLTQCTSERGLYGVALGAQTGALGTPQFQYSQPDGTGRAALMVWDNIPAGGVTVTEVAPDPIKPSVAFCSLQPDGNVPLTMDGEEVPLNDGVMSIDLDVGDTLMCDWYRWPGGATAGDEGDGGDNGGDGNDDGGDGAGAAEGVTYDPDGGDGGNPELVGSQIFIQKWTCVDGEQIDGRPEILDTNSADGLAELEQACDLATGSYQFTLGDVLAEGEEEGVEQEEGAAEDEQTADEDAGEDGGDVPEFQGIVAEDGTIVDEEGGPDEAVAGGPTGEGEADVNQGIVADDEEADDAGADDAGADEADVNEGDADDAAGDGEGAVGVYPPLEIGGIVQYEGWNGLAAGSYTILEAVPDGYGEPLVLCDGIFTGAQAGENIFELTAIDGAVLYDLSEGELLLCSWFNVQQDGEAEEDTDGGVDAATNDLDDDGLIDAEETDTYGTDPNDEDSDDDDVVDGDEILAGTDPNNPDTDGDTFTDSEELYQLGTDPLVYDLGPLDDDDGDFLLNGEEVHEYGTDPFRSDSDMDGLSDYLEVITYGSDPWVEDTDGDGYKDAVEADAGTDPTVPDR